MVRADKAAVVAHVAGGRGNGGRTAAAAAAVEDVADGRREFTAGCFLEGSGRLALGTCAGDVEVYGYAEGGGGAGGRLSNFKGKTPLPEELEMKGEAEVWLDSIAWSMFFFATCAPCLFSGK